MERENGEITLADEKKTEKYLVEPEKVRTFAPANREQALIRGGKGQCL